MPILFYVRQFPEAKQALESAGHLAKYYARNAERPSFKATEPSFKPQLAA